MMRIIDDPRTVSVSEHLKGISAVNLSGKETIAIMERQLRIYGPVERKEFAAFPEALDFLLPIKSFTTRYLVLGMERWSVLVTDMQGENCYVDAYAISRAASCNGIGIFMQMQRRELHVFEGGKHVREVQSLLDVDQWYYREHGPLQPFEDVAEYAPKKKQYRLKVDAVIRYYQRYTGLNLPDWKNPSFTSHIGLERCNKDRRVPLHRFHTMRDL